jgi:hypothetical protein
VHTAEELGAKHEAAQRSLRWMIVVTVLLAAGLVALRVTNRDMGELACQLGAYAGILAIAKQRPRIWRLSDAVARANTLARPDGRSGQRVKVLGD